LVEKIDKMAEQARKGNSTIRSSATMRTSAGDSQEVWEDIRARLKDKLLLRNTRYL